MEDFMKRVLFIAGLFASTAASALEYHCTKTVSNTRTETVLIKTWPELSVIRSSKAAAIEEIASPSQVCGKAANVETDCQLQEKSLPDGTGSISVACRNQVHLEINVRNKGADTITCSERGILRKSWNVGSCVIP
jgi:hypothetical protein